MRRATAPSVLTTTARHDVPRGAIGATPAARGGPADAVVATGELLEQPARATATSATQRARRGRGTARCSPGHLQPPSTPCWDSASGGAASVQPVQQQAQQAGRARVTDLGAGPPV